MKKKVPATEPESEGRGANAVDRHVGERVRTTRLKRHMSQEKLAEILGITFQQVQKYEKGTNRTAASRLYEIAIALEVPISYFFEGLPGVDGNEDEAQKLDENHRASIARQIRRKADEIVVLSEKLDA